jgi:hypothetical protein
MIRLKHRFLFKLSILFLIHDDIYWEEKDVNVQDMIVIFIELLLRLFYFMSVLQYIENIYLCNQFCSRNETMLI